MNLYGHTDLGQNWTYVPNIVPTGTVDGNNTSFTLPVAPIDGTLDLKVDGITLLSTEYTLTVAALEVNVAPAVSIVCNFCIPN